MLKIDELKSTALILIISSILLSSFIFLTSDFVWAGETKGKVVKIKDGKLERFTDGKWKEIKKDNVVSLGDRLRTDKNGLAVIELPKTGRFVIGPDSEIELGKETKDFKGNLSRGAVWLNSSLPKGKKASITTTLATAGIRGTAFTVCYDGKNFCACTCLGEVEVILNNGKIIKVPKGEYISFASDSSIPEKPQSAMPLLVKGETAFNFCFNCHTVGGRGKLNQDWE